MKLERLKFYIPGGVAFQNQLVHDRIRIIVHLAIVEAVFVDHPKVLVFSAREISYPVVDGDRTGTHYPESVLWQDLHEIFLCLVRAVRLTELAKPKVDWG